MERLTTDNPQNNIETMMNMVFGKDGWFRIRDDGEGKPITDFAIKLCIMRGCDMAPDMELSQEAKDECLCDCLMEPCPIADVYAALSGFGHIRGRLKAYEDSGLTPERAAELGKADREGRVAVVPYKVGDTVYVISQCDWVERRLDGSLYSQGPYGITAGSATGYYCAYDGREEDCPLSGEDECDQESFAIFETTVTGMFARYSDDDNQIGHVEIGVDGINRFLDDKVYATREEAEAALAEKEKKE